ncbi:MAG: GAF domain-containing protein [Thermomicrobium sp.]|nr:GAF domain-containing protein [Thermomicrobium sp.]
MPTSKTTPLAVEELLRNVLRTLLPLVNADLGGFFVFDECLQRVVLGTVEGEQPPRSVPPIGVLRVPPAAVPAERWIQEHRRPLHLFRPNDWNRFPPVNPGLRTLARTGNLVALVIPLQDHDELIGVAYFWRHRSPRPFLRSEIRLAERWCQLASLVAVASRLYQREAVARRALERVLDIDRSLATVQSVEALGRIVTRALAEFLGLDAIVLWLRADEGDQWSLTANVPLSGALGDALNAWRPDGSRLKNEASAVHRLSREEASDLVGSWTAFLPAATTEIVSCVIQRDGHCVGFLAGWHTGSFTEDRHANAHGISSIVPVLLEQVAVTLGRLAHRAQLERTVGDLRSLLQVSQRVVTAPTVESLLDDIERILRERLRYDAMIFLVPDQSVPNTLRIAWGSGAISEARFGDRIPVDGSLAGWVFRTGRELAVTDTWEDPRTYHRPDQRVPLRSLLLFPIRHEQRTIGVLGFGRQHVAPFSEYERKLAGVVAREIATAFLVVEQRETLSRRARDQALLSTVSQLLLRDFAPGTFGEPLVRELADRLGCSVAFALECPLTPGRVLAVADGDPTHRLPDLTPLLGMDFYGPLAAVGAQEPFELVDPARFPACVQATLRELRARFGTVHFVPLLPDDTPSGFLLLAFPACRRVERQELILTLRELRNRIVHAVERWIVGIEQGVINRLAMDLAGQTSIDEFATSLLAQLHTLLPYEFGALFEFDAANGRFVLMHATAHFDEFTTDWTIAEEALRTLEPDGPTSLLYVPDATRLDLGYPLRRATLGTPSSIVLAPLRTREALWGLLLLGRFGIDRFTVGERRRLASLATTAALAYQAVAANQREREIYRASVEALAAAIDAKDPATHDHSRRVARLARLVAEHLALKKEEIDEIELAALLHDIGKLAVPDQILTKPDRLDTSEWALVRLHPVVGADILAGHPRLERIVPLVRAHHERWDGQGYPDGLRGEEIPIGAAVIALADAFDTMISDRPYRPARPLADAIAELRRHRGRQFHPRVVDAFLAALRNPSGLPLFLAEHVLRPAAPLTVHALHELGTRLPTNATIDAVAEVIDLAISGTLSNDNVAIFLLDEADETLRLVYSRHERELVHKVRIPKGLGIAWHAIESATAVAVIVPEVSPDRLARWERRELYAVLAAPLVDHDRVFGAIVLSRTERRAFTASDADLLTRLGQQIGALVHDLLERADGSPQPSTDETVHIDQA